MRALCMAALVLSAGCLSSEAAEIQAPAARASFGEETGAIRGVVVDDSLNPMPNLLVGLNGGNASLTDGAGAFVYSDLLPGTYEVLVQGVAVLPVSTRVEVVAQQATEVTIAVQHLPSTEPYLETRIQDGITFCGTSFREPGAAKPSYLQICGVLFYAGLTDYDRFRLDWQIPMPGLVGLWAETVWVRNSAAAGGYNVLWDVFDSSGNIRLIGSNGSGQSPLQVRIERAAIDAQVEAHGDGDCPADGECHLGSFHASYGETLGPSAPVDAAVSVMQRYSVYLTSFYHGELPNEFTAVGDS
jgi:hypothetical protein